MGGSVAVESEVGVGSEFKIIVKTKCKVATETYKQITERVDQIDSAGPYTFIWQEGNVLKKDFQENDKGPSESDDMKLHSQI